MQSSTFNNPEFTETHFLTVSISGIIPEYQFISADEVLKIYDVLVPDFHTQPSVPSTSSKPIHMDASLFVYAQLEIIRSASTSFTIVAKCDCG